MTPDVSASVRARLLALARNAQEEFQLYLVRYACERFLYRLGRSPHRSRCALKGAGLLTLWMNDPYRPTRDLDFLAWGANDRDAVRELVAEVCSVECPEDGIAFDLTGLAIEPIRAEQEYPGQRARLTALLGTARIRFQLDFGFGDAVTPAPEETRYPTLLPDLPAPVIRAYRREVSIAEKFEVMVELGRRNSRMKDFHDVWALSSRFSFDGPTLLRAVHACFERRGTSLEELPEVLRPAFYEQDSLASSWSGYLQGSTFPDPPPSLFGTIGERVRRFLGPVRDGILIDGIFDQHWPASGPWQPRGDAQESGASDV